MTLAPPCIITNRMTHALTHTEWFVRKGKEEDGVESR